MVVQDTSVAAYDGLRDSLPRRERLVWSALSKCTAAPTAYELTESMKRAGLAFDLNSVRPRLTALYERGSVQRLGKRACAITGRKVYTWAVVPRNPPVPPVKKPRRNRPTAVEAGLF